MTGSLRFRLRRRTQQPDSEQFSRQSMPRGQARRRSKEFAAAGSVGRLQKWRPD
jgi:hypothetical protein